MLGMKSAYTEEAHHSQSPPETSNDDVESNQQPLLGVVLCCTSIAPDLRDAIYTAAKEIGAVTNLDLTADVTHLVVGATDTPKYKYVARERPDMKVLLPSWLHAVRECWMEGGDVEITKLEEEHRVPTLWGLNICVTGFNDLQERSAIAEAVSANGATYHGDLTKNVSHLIALAPQGKKYEYAGQWGIKIVAIEWLKESLKRGMILDETSFSPTIPVEDRGKGALAVLERANEERARVGKRKGSELTGVNKGPEGKRKLRRTASSKLESQNSGIWADMDNTESYESGFNMDWDDGAILTKPGQQSSGSRQDSYREEAERQAHAEIVGNGQASRRDQNFIFEGFAFMVCGFDHRESTILCEHLQLNGGVILQHPGELPNAFQKSLDITCITPYERTKKEAKDEAREWLCYTRNFGFATNLWIEKCIFIKTLVDADCAALCRPLRSRSVFKSKITITPTSFVGIDLLHFSKAVKLVGLQYDETLTDTTDVLICSNKSTANVTKLRFALEKRIPVLTVEWFWDSLKQGTMLSKDPYFIRLDLHKRSATDSESSLHDPGSKSNSSGIVGRRTEPEAIDNQHPSNATANRTSTFLDLREQRQNSDYPSQNSRKSQPLRELTENDANSSRRSQSSQPGLKQLDGEAEALPHEQQPVSFISHDDETFRPPSALKNSFKSLDAPSKPSDTQQSRDFLNDAIAHLRAQKQSVLDSDRTPQHRRHRTLGRAPSNPSSLGSRQNSMTKVPSQVEEDDEEQVLKKKKELPMPSQALMYEREESKIVREQLMRSGQAVEVDDANGLKRVESIGKVRDATPPTKKARVQTRKRMMKE